jgi:hypothetical protein
MNLYLVRCKGLRSSMGGSLAWGIAYVAAENPTKAYNKLRDFLNQEDYGFASDRVMESIELIASDDRYPDCGTRFYP